MERAGHLQRPVLGRRGRENGPRPARDEREFAAEVELGGSADPDRKDWRARTNRQVADAASERTELRLRARHAAFREDDDDLAACERGEGRRDRATVAPADRRSMGMTSPIRRRIGRCHQTQSSPRDLREDGSGP